MEEAADIEVRMRWEHDTSFLPVWLSCWVVKKEEEEEAKLSYSDYLWKQSNPDKTVAVACGSSAGGRGGWLLPQFSCSRSACCHF